MRNLQTVESAGQRELVRTSDIRQNPKTREGQDQKKPQIRGGPRRMPMRNVRAILGTILFGACWVGCSSPKTSAPSLCQYWASNFKRSTISSHGYQVVALRDYTGDAQRFFHDIPKPPKKFPACVEGDFNGDGIQDVALLLWRESGEPRREGCGVPVKMRIVVMKGQKNGTSRTLDLAEFDDCIPTEEALRYVSPGIYGPNPYDPKKTRLELKHPAFEVGGFEAAMGTVFFWQDNKFESLRMGE